MLLKIKRILKLTSMVAVLVCLLSSMSIFAAQPSDVAAISANQTEIVYHYEPFAANGDYVFCYVLPENVTDTSHYNEYDVTCLNRVTNEWVQNAFMCDGVYTYYFQYDCTAMKDCLTYHPDGVHLIKFDYYGHEVFDDFSTITHEELRLDMFGNYTEQTITSMAYFDTFGYMYFDKLTYDSTGTYLYYATPTAH